jgi:arabinofuranan 3-O-arabinosyltransferase
VRVDSDRAALLVVHENANAGWQATLGGHRLRAVRVDGWEQAFVVPAGSHGTVQLAYAPQRGFELGLAGGLAAALALILLTVMRPRRPAPALLGRLEDAQPRRVLLAAGVLIAAGLLAGWAGAVAAAAVGIAGLITGRSLHPRFSAALSGGVLVIAGLVVARSEPAQLFAQQNSGQVQLLCVTGLAIGAFSAFRRGRTQRDE